LLAFHGVKPDAMTFRAAIDGDLAKGYFFHGLLTVGAIDVGKFIQLSVGGK
jgi:hypothetical protein